MHTFIIPYNNTEVLNFKNSKCDYVYPESSVIGYSSKRCLSMFGFNINSMPENFEEFISIDVAPLQFSFDFIWLSETKFFSDIEYLYEMQNYNRYCINVSRREGGLLFLLTAYIRQS